MRIYSNTITREDVRRAFDLASARHDADIYIDTLRSFRARSHAHGHEVYAYSVNGERRAQHGDGGQRAASWSDYGYAIAHLYTVDPAAKIGCYTSRDDFVAKVTQRARARPDLSLAFLAVLGDQP